MTEIDWKRERSRNGGADRIPLPPDVAGGLWLCGKHFVGPDVEEAMRKTGATTVVCLNQPREIEDRYPAYAAWLSSSGERAVWFPVPDLHAPDLDAAVAFVDALVDRVRAGETLLVHCGAGIGRAGTMAAAILMDLGLTMDEAIAVVASSRPMAGPEAGAQRDLLEALAAR